MTAVRLVGSEHWRVLAARRAAGGVHASRHKVLLARACQEEQRGQRQALHQQDRRSQVPFIKESVARLKTQASRWRIIKTTAASCASSATNLPNSSVEAARAWQWPRRPARVPWRAYASSAMKPRPRCPPRPWRSLDDGGGASRACPCNRAPAAQAAMAAEDRPARSCSTSDLHSSLPLCLCLPHASSRRRRARSEMAQDRIGHARERSIMRGSVGRARARSATARDPATQGPADGEQGPPRWAASSRRATSTANRRASRVDGFAHGIPDADGNHWPPPQRSLGWFRSHRCAWRNDV